MSIRLQQYLKKWQNLFDLNKDELAKHKLFNEIWQQYHKRLLFFIKAILADAAEDVLQEIMLKVYHNLENYNPIYSFNSWIYTVARNHCINTMAKKRLQTLPMTQETEQTIYVENNNPENEFINREACQHIDRFLEQLPAKHQQMAFLRFYEGMILAEISKTLQVPLGTIKSRIDRGMLTVDAKMRALFSE